MPRPHRRGAHGSHGGDRALSEAVAGAGASGLPASARATRLLLRLVVLAAAFAAVPLALYETFQRADDARRALLLHNAQDQARVIVAALVPLLDRHDPQAVERINRAASGFAGDGTTLRILYSRGDGDAALLVAAHPPVADRDFAAIRARLRQAEGAGIDRARCTGSVPLDSRVAGAGGQGEILVAAAMSGDSADCWTVLVGSRSAPFLANANGRPFWDAPEIRLAAIAHLALFAVAAWLLARSWAETRALARMQARAAPRMTIAPQLVPVTAPDASLPASASAPDPVAAPVAATPAEARAPSAPPPSVDLRKLVADRVFDLHEVCSRNGLSLSYEALQPVQVRAPAAEIDAILAALLARAVATSRHGDVMRVALRSADAEARLHIEDAGHDADADGVAMPPAMAGATGPGAREMTDDPAADPVLTATRRRLEELGGALDTQRLETGALRVTVRFPRATAPDAADA